MCSGFFRVREMDDTLQWTMRRKKKWKRFICFPFKSFCICLSEKVLVILPRWRSGKVCAQRLRANDDFVILNDDPSQVVHLFQKRNEGDFELCFLAAPDVEFAYVNSLWNIWTNLCMNVNIYFHLSLHILDTKTHRIYTFRNSSSYSFILIDTCTAGPSSVTFAFFELWKYDNATFPIIASMFRRVVYICGPFHYAMRHASIPAVHWPCFFIEESRRLAFSLPLLMKEAWQGKFAHWLKIPFAKVLFRFHHHCYDYFYWMSIHADVFPFLGSSLKRQPIVGQYLVHSNGSI